MKQHARSRQNKRPNLILKDNYRGWKCKIKTESYNEAHVYQTPNDDRIGIESKSPLFSRARGAWENKRHVKASAGHHTFHSVSHKTRTKALCVRGSGPLNDGPLSSLAATQTFLTDIQSGKFEPKQDGLLLVPPCLLDWSAPICAAVWVARRKMMGSLSDKGEWGVNCYSAERNHQTSSCRSWRAVSRALQKPGDRATRGCSPPASGKYTGAEAVPASAPPTGTLYQSGQKKKDHL